MHKIKKCCHQKKFTNAIADSNLIDEDIINPFGYQACIETAIFEELKNQEDFDITDLFLVHDSNPC